MVKEPENQNRGAAKGEQMSQAKDRHGEQQHQGGKAEKSQPQRDSDRDQRASGSKQRE